MKKKIVGVRHGDVIVVETKDNIRGDEQKNPVLALGEVTGHSHQMKNGIAKVFKYNEKTYLQVISKIATLSHEEHGDIELKQGNYEFFIQQEWKEDGWTKVID